MAIKQSSSFMYQVLSGLRSLEELSNMDSGVPIKQLISFIKHNYRTDGDVINQVKTALQHSICLGFVRCYYGKYQLIVPAAKVLNQPSNSINQQREILRIQKIFAKKRPHQTRSRCRTRSKTGTKSKSNSRCRSRSQHDSMNKNVSLSRLNRNELTGKCSIQNKKALIAKRPIHRNSNANQLEITSYSHDHRRKRKKYLDYSDESDESDDE